VTGALSTDMGYDIQSMYRRLRKSGGFNKGGIHMTVYTVTMFILGIAILWIGSEIVIA